MGNGEDPLEGPTVGKCFLRALQLKVGVGCRSLASAFPESLMRKARGKWIAELRHDKREMPTKPQGTRKRTDSQAKSGRFRFWLCILLGFEAVEWSSEWKVGWCGIFCWACYFCKTNDAMNQSLCRLREGGVFFASIACVCVVGVLLGRLL